MPCKSGGEEDVDDDGLTLEVELQKGTDPNRYDTDNDGIGDARDAMPLCPNSFCDVTYGENEDTCEEDCKSATGSGVLLVVLIIVLILAAIVGFFYFQYKSSSKVLSDEGGMRWKGFGDSGSGGESGEKRGSTKHRSMMIQHKGRRSYERHKERKEKESDVEQKLRESIETFEQVRRR